MATCQAIVPVRHGIQTISFEQKKAPLNEVCGEPAYYSCVSCGKELCGVHAHVDNQTYPLHGEGRKIGRYYCGDCHPDEKIRKSSESLTLIKP